MRSITLLLLISSLAAAETVTFNNGSESFDIEFVEIGNPGNSPNPTTTRGDVDYIYHIAKFEVSREMVEIAGFGSKLHPMDEVAPVLPDIPASGLDWVDASRFVNWLNANHEYADAYKSSIGLSLWEEGEDGFDPDNRMRNRLARFALPSSDELHKAGFYDPGKDGGAGGYWRYATGSDEPPFPVAWGTTDGTAVYDQPFFDGPAGIDVAGGLSPYGVMAISGNIQEWEETAFDGVNDRPNEEVGVVSGHWGSKERHMHSGVRASYAKGVSLPTFGFRVVMLADPMSVPEPSTNLLFGLALIGLARLRRETR